ncbi:methyl-accepting chemotaxis protein [Rugamonas aquatica]|uniref:HAMP domain-containing protein n=1 Tax=Rugamonas aquatica TaxID=2743357 RepID=A0A6A7MVN8_9BURK|nr:methyl-accepting chemotaxis protein [Rugamonas aquatica]MQA37093.1 HAMP domain-containing protein [Rugamonas aquatica]
MNVSNWNIGTRLSVGFGIVLALLLAVTVLGITRMSQVQERLDEIANVNNPEGKLADLMLSTVTDRSIALRNLALLTDMKDMQPEADRIRVNEQKYAEAEKKLNQMFAALPSTTDRELALMPKIKEAEAAALPLMAKAAKLGLDNKADEATKVLIGELRPVQRKWLDLLTQLSELETTLNTEAGNDAAVAYSSARLMMILLSAAAIGMGVLIAWLATRSITLPMQQAVRVAQTVAAGDLTSKIEVRTTDETGMLLQALLDMNNHLQDIVGQVRGGTDTIATASSQIASGNLDLSQRTEEQASSLEETASSMEELTSTVKQNADNARQANQLAASASDVAGRGGSVVAEVVVTMNSINDSSKKIVDIIGVIDGIAFQTNILALNAAVEAARAGEQGRGFAVVASEVRNLAQRSAAAAKEIKALINDSVEKVDVGARLVNQAGVTMDEIVASIRSVTDIMGEITAASQEQEVGIEQINQAVAQMDTVTQQNAALVEQAAAAAASLQEQAAGLSEVVSVFKLDQAHRPAARLARPSAQRLALPAHG